MRHDKKITCAGFICLPAVHFYLLEAYTHNGWIQVRPWAQCFNILLFQLAAVFLFFLFRSQKRALRAEGMAAMLYGLVNYYVYTFRSLPLVPWDIFSIQTAMHVADNYNFMPSLRVVLVLLAFSAVLVLEGFFDFSLEKKYWRQSLAAAAAVCLVLLGFCHVLQQEEFQNRHRMYNKLFTPVYLWQVNGSALTLVMELPYLSVEKPADYNRTQQEEILASYEDANAQTASAASGSMPNIIVIMDEAFSDLSVLGEFTASEDPLPFCHRLMAGEKNTVSGFLHVSVCGGNTANTEFEFLTGNTMAFLPKGSIPYQQYIKQEIPSIPSYLRSLGYETCAMHPFYAAGWDRDQVYPLLGFEKMAFLQDYTGASYVRDYVSDDSCVDKIIQTYETKEEGKPLFVFNVTMQNHGSYGDVYDNFAPDIRVEGKTSYPLSAYLSLTQKSDEALQKLISYFSRQKEPVMVVFFGDHQPNDTVAEPILELNGMTYQTLTEEETERRYQVPYVIWTNYAMETETNRDTSANYLGVKMLEEAGIALPAYQNYLKQLQESYPIISALHTKGSGQEDLLHAYQNLQYFQLFDRAKKGK